MPLARIITLHPDQTGALFQQLQSQGYAVEVVSPDEIVIRPADLEIDFEVCPAGRALERAAEVAQHLNTDVAVAPGLPEQALHGQVVPEPATPSLIEEPASQFAPADLHHQADFHPEIEAPEAQHATALPQEHEFPPPIVQEAIVPAIEEHATPPQQEQHTEVLNHQEQSTVIEQSHFAHDADLPAAPLNAEEEQPAPTPFIQTSPTNAVAPLPETGEPEPSRRRAAEILAPLAEKASRAIVAGKVLASEAWVSAQHAGKEYRERLDIRREEARAAREQRLLDLAKRKALATERAAELEAARQSASARLQQLLRERAVEPVLHTPAVYEEAAATSAVPERQNGRPAWPRMNAWRTYLVSWMGKRYTPQLEAVLTGVAAATALFAIGLALYSFHPRPALSSSIDQPYKGVTVKTGGTTVGGNPVAATQPVSKPSPSETEQRPTAKQSPHRSGTASDVTVRHFAPSRRISRAASDGVIADDVTIRHFGAQAKPPAAKTTPQAGLKHISDM
jgi:hypothetical protein